jgi:hypothetical protein
MEFCQHMMVLMNVGISDTNQEQDIPCGLVEDSEGVSLLGNIQ